MSTRVSSIIYNLTVIGLIGTVMFFCFIGGVVWECERWMGGVVAYEDYEDY